MEKPDIVIEKLYLHLENMARNIIRENLDLSIKENRDFLNNPDDVNHQKPKWHQFGIITHTKMVEKAFREELPVYLKKWGIKDRADMHLDEKIEGIKKKDLFIMTIVLHDTGKFKVRTMNKKNGTYSFKPHEKASGEIIRSLKNTLMKDFFLTEHQIEYIARCAELHFELGLLRYTGKDSKTGFNREFIKSDTFKNTVMEFISKNPDFKWEIGLFFLADTLGKIDIRINDENNIEEIEKAKKEINEKKAYTGIINGILQLPVNLAATEEYFRILLES
ncbi:MAG: hypothetical protein ABRQ39_05555 [Candidatus Eremiobacterota bacterium]